MAYSQQWFYVPSSALVAGHLDPIQYNSTLGNTDPNYLREHGLLYRNIGQYWGIGQYKAVFTLAQQGLEVLDLTQCRQAFDTEFVTGYKGLIVVVNATDFPTLWPMVPEYSPDSFVYPDLRLSLRSAPISHCLAVRVAETCKLRFNAPLAWTVVALNAVKVIVLTLTYYNARGGAEPLMLIGDGIASFVDQPDSTTTSLCFMQKSTLSWWKYNQKRPQTLSQGRARRRTSVGRTRWATWLTL